jgi:hypothetical protein
MSHAAFAPCRQGVPVLRLSRFILSCSAVVVVFAVALEDSPLAQGLRGHGFARGIRYAGAVSGEAKFCAVVPDGLSDGSGGICGLPLPRGHAPKHHRVASRHPGGSAADAPILRLDPDGGTGGDARTEPGPSGDGSSESPGTYKVADLVQLPDGFLYFDPPSGPGAGSGFPPGGNPSPPGGSATPPGDDPPGNPIVITGAGSPPPGSGPSGPTISDPTPAQDVPEPLSLSLVLGGLALIAGTRKRRAG